MRRSNQIIYLFFLGLIGIVLQSCDQNRFFEQDLEVRGEQWAFQNEKDFVVKVNDTNSLFNFYLNVRNTTDYPYANLYVFIETTFPDTETAKDTIELQLANIKGKWLGDGIGKYKYNRFILRKAMRFVQQGEYIFSIKQGMRTDTLQGISDIGIRLEYYP